MSHTQGEWSRNIKPARKYNTIFAGRNTHVAHLHIQGLSDVEIEANCNLIAAAPDLLEALKEMLIAGADEEIKTLAHRIAHTKAHNAIAKAEGK